MRLFTGSMILLLAAAVAEKTPAAEKSDLDTQLMLSTFKLANPGSTATAFILTRPGTTHSVVAADANKTQFILVTARHVFDQMRGDEATLHFRKQTADGRYAKSPMPLKVRQAGKNLWTKHPTADVAVMYVSPPADVRVPHLPTELLASDNELQKYEVHPGDTLRAIGFPHANEFEANEGGFAVVRSGCVASYPLLPTKTTRTFFFAFNSFEGDSGAAVYLAENNRFYGGKTQEGRVQLILGLVSEQQFLDEEIKMAYQTWKFRHRLGLGIVVHASAIKETIALLPP
jgi:hypothetical protein